MLILIVVFLGVAYAVFKRLERTTLLPVDDFVAGISSYVDCNYKDISYENLESLYNFVVENDQSMKKQISSSLLALRWRLIMEILSGSKKSFTDFEFQLKMLEMPMYPSNFMVMVIELERRKELQFSGFKDFIGLHMETILKEIENITSEDGVKCVSLKMHDDNIVCVFSFLDNTLESNISRTMTYANVLKSNVFAKTGEAMNIGIGGYYVDFRNVSDSYREAMIALERKFLFGKNSIISIEDIRFPGEADVFGISKKIELLKSIGIEKMSKRVDDIFEDMLLSNVDYEVFYMFAVQIVLAIFDNENIKEYKNDIIADEVFVDVYTYLNQFDVLTDAKNYVLELVEEIKKRIA